MRTTNLLSVVRETWNNFAADRPISSVVDVSVNVSTNHVYRMDLKSDDHLFAKISYFGTYQHFREDHSIIQALSQVLPDPYEGFLAHSYRQDEAVHTARHALLGQDVWVVFYRPVAIGERLSRKLETQHITSLGRELGKDLGVLVANPPHFEIEPLARHMLVGLAERNPALLGFGLGHDQLAEFAVHRAALEKIVELYLLQATWGPKALLVARRHVAGRLLAFRFRFGALEDNDVAGHSLRKGRKN